METGVKKTIILIFIMFSLMGGSAFMSILIMESIRKIANKFKDWWQNKDN